jgi:hypothetical protein
MSGELLACFVLLFLLGFMLRGRNQNKQIALNYANVLHTTVAYSFKQAGFPTSLLKWCYFGVFHLINIKSLVVDLMVGVIMNILLHLIHFVPIY